MQQQQQHSVQTAVSLNYEDLLQGKDLSHLIEEAYGPDGLGILTVNGVPNLQQLRQNLLPLAHNIAHLSDSQKHKLEHAHSNYGVGWSHGKERFQDRLDTAKGSYYANPQYDVPTQDETLVDKYPSYCAPNIWPTEDVPQLENAFKEMGQLIVTVGLLVAKQCDTYVKRVVPSYQENKLHDTIAASKCTKGRLLYYFPLNSEQDIQEASDQCMDNWCGWHLDHGSLTGLTSAIYLDQDGNQVQVTDPNAGLFIKNRKGDLVKVAYRGDQLAYQIGESAQIHSGGRLVATPHCVRGASTANVARSTLAVFMQPQWDVSMNPPQGLTVQECQIDVLEENMDFNGFSEKRFAQYYGGSDDATM
jgi:isopenicillin N synthase-like dioxygenase